MKKNGIIKKYYKNRIDKKRIAKAVCTAKTVCRENMARVLNKTAVQFLSQSQKSFEVMMTEGVKLIADIMDLDRISVWQNSKKADETHVSQIYRWDRESGGTTGIIPELIDVTYSSLTPSWEKILSCDNTINSPVHMQPPQEAELLRKFGVVSLFVAPIFISNDFWGFVLFEDRKKERYFEEDLTELMRSAAFLCANAVIREDYLRNIKLMTDEVQNQSELLKLRLEQQELISEISRRFVSSDDTKLLIKEAIAKLGHYYKVSSVIIYNLDYKSGTASVECQWFSMFKEPRRKVLNTRELIKNSFPQRLYDCVTLPILSCTDTRNSKDSVFSDVLAEGVIAFICAPLYVEGILWGFLAVEQKDNPREWTDNEKKFIATTASTIAGAIMLDIYNTKLKNAVTEMTAASKAKSEFLSNMSHEMRTPMNAIINMTTIAKNTYDIDRKNYALEKIGDASTHLLGVINDILDMSKIEANKFELFPVVFDFEKMIAQVVNVINFRVEEKHQTFLVNIDGEIPKILIGDDQRISQVITNLLSNAVKFTPEKGIISLNAKLTGEYEDTFTSEAVCTLQISITDTGIGINKKHQKNLFQSFQQAESNTARNYGGTGLGLSISKSFVNMMGGKIWVESEQGKGSTFAFTIKVKRGKKNTEEDKTEISQTKNIDNFKGQTILLAEDMEINREIVMMLLEPTNLKLECAVNGVQAVEMYTENPEKYDLILMDVHMPGMDGYEATRQIRIFEEKQISKLQSDRHIPIIAMTANVFKEDIDNCLKAGMDDHIGKPLDFDIVIKKLRNYISNP